MSGILGTLASLAAACALTVTGTLDAAAPQHDPEGLLFLVNREWCVSRYYVPELRETQVPGQLRRMRPDAASALERMYADFKAETGITLVDVSGYRAYSKQSVIYARKVRNSGSKKKADEYVARPGASEHQLGIAMDVGQRGKGSLTEAFARTEGGRWLAGNCWKYGFIIRYGKEYEDVTGYRYEPWHVRWVGVEYAKQIHDAGDPPLETWLSGKREEMLMEILTSE